MKTSELIANLQAAIEEYGDLPVLVLDDVWYGDPYIEHETGDVYFVSPEVQFPALVLHRSAHHEKEEL